MKNVKIIMLSVSLALMMGLGACKKTKIEKTTALTVQTKLPNTLENVVLKSAKLTFSEVNSGAVTTSETFTSDKFTITLPEGAYNIVLEGNIEHLANGEKITSKVRALKEAVIITGGTASVDLSMFLYKGEENFVIKEVFFTGTVTPEGKAYNGDKYFIIYNNTDKLLYADSLMIAESTFLTTTKRIYTPDVMATDFTASSIVMIPGNGKTYPVQAGKSIVIANNAINHLEYNANSVNLTSADFELTLLSSINVDNPQVKDLDNISGFMTMHNRGFKSYVIAKMKSSVSEFLTSKAYTYTYVNSAGGTTSGNGFKIPNTWVLDAVNLSVASEFNWILTSPELDMGWTFSGKVDSDATRFGKSVLRKVLSTTPGGRQILQDTNNSKDDFNPEAKPSLFK